MNPIRVLICGDRNWTDRGVISGVVAGLPEDAVVIHGGARGADRIGGEEAEARGLSVEVYRAEWDRYGRAAGPIRNKRMLDEGRPDVVCAFHDDLSSSRGTADMVKRADRVGVVTLLYSHGEPVQELTAADAQLALM